VRNYDLFDFAQLSVRAENRINRNISENRHNLKTLCSVSWLHCQKLQA